MLDPNFNGTYWIDGNTYTLKFPCNDSKYCFPIQIYFNPGKYKLELFGASAGYYQNYITSYRNPNNISECLYKSEIEEIGGNYSCPSTGSNSGAGGYASGILNLKSGVIAFLNLGGQGEYCRPPGCQGGYNGGGDCYVAPQAMAAASGGGASDLRILENSLFLRILVAGGGGGADNPPGTSGGSDDGTGGAGGYPGQGYFTNGRYEKSKEVTTTNGFSFGNGMMSNNKNGEYPGAGGGFFGGYASGGYNSGAGGGSSFALSRKVPVPKNLLSVKSGNGTIIEQGYYKLSETGPYELDEVRFVNGANIGNGYARITILESYPIKYIPFLCTLHYNDSIFLAMLMKMLVPFVFIDC